jgi:4a-hydroxytetrahydrobiopterin dehydratase
VSDLTKLSCVPPKKSDAVITDIAIKEYMKQLPSWKIVDLNGINQLERAYKFDTFIEALAFTNEIGELAESEDHHPAITTEWGRVTVTWWTHAVNGLHRNDFIMAAKSDLLYER